MERLIPIEIFTIGDYKLQSLRTYCHDIKKGDYITIREVAAVLARKIPADAIIIPIPSLSGYNEAFCRMISNYSGHPIEYCLMREGGHGSLYDKKKRGESVTEEDTGIMLHGFPPDGRLVLVDNVIATGTTMSAAIRAIGRPCEAACIAVDWAIFNMYNNRVYEHN